MLPSRSCRHARLVIGIKGLLIEVSRAILGAHRCRMIDNPAQVGGIGDHFLAGRRAEASHHKIVVISFCKPPIGIEVAHMSVRTTAGEDVVRIFICDGRNNAVRCSAVRKIIVVAVQYSLQECAGIRRALINLPLSLEYIEEITYGLIALWVGDNVRSSNVRRTKKVAFVSPKSTLRAVGSVVDRADKCSRRGVAEEPVVGSLSAPVAVADGSTSRQRYLGESAGFAARISRCILILDLVRRAIRVVD